MNFSSFQISSPWNFYSPLSNFSINKREWKFYVQLWTLEMVLTLIWCHAEVSLIQPSLHPVSHPIQSPPCHREVLGTYRD